MAEKEENRDIGIESRKSKVKTVKGSSKGGNVKRKERETWGMAKEMINPDAEDED